MKKFKNHFTINTPRAGLKDIWNAYMAKDALFSENDIPFCPTTATKLPNKIITWSEAITIYHKIISINNDFFIDAFVCFYIDDYKFDGPSGIWHSAKKTLSIIHHFAGAITPDFSTFQDFPEPIKLFATYRMRLFGYWLGKKGIQIINNVRWGTSETYKYCFDGIPQNSIVCIGTVGGSPRKIIDRDRFESGLFEMITLLHPHTILVYGSDKYTCFKILKSQGINIISFQSQTSIAYERRKHHE